MRLRVFVIGLIIAALGVWLVLMAKPKPMARPSPFALHQPLQPELPVRFEYPAEWQLEHSHGTLEAYT